MWHAQYYKVIKPHIQCSLREAVTTVITRSTFHLAFGESVITLCNVCMLTPDTLTMYIMSVCFRSWAFFARNLWMPFSNHVIDTSEKKPKPFLSGCTYPMLTTVSPMNSSGTAQFQPVMHGFSYNFIPLLPVKLLVWHTEGVQELSAMGVARDAPLGSDGHSQKGPERWILCDLTVKCYEC